MECSISNISNNLIRAGSFGSDELSVLWESEVSHHESDDDVASTRSDTVLIGLEMERTILDLNATRLSVCQELGEDRLRFMESDPLGLRQPPHVRIRPEPVSIEQLNATIWGGIYADPMTDRIAFSEEEDDDTSFPIERVFDLPDTHQVWVRNDADAWEQRTDLRVREGMIFSCSSEETTTLSSPSENFRHD